MAMPIRVEIFAAGGIAVGTLARAGHVRDALECGDPLPIERTTWHALDGSRPRPIGEVTVAPDDVLLATADEAEAGAAGVAGTLGEEAVEDAREELRGDSRAGVADPEVEEVSLALGPYHVRGQMPTMPGFDPGRALARPTGEFVQLRDVTIGLDGEPVAGMVRPMAFANRYCVERVEADLMLGVFFPGAEIVTTPGPSVAAAGVAPAPIEAAPPL
jgi:hypothetical protein